MANKSLFASLTSRLPRANAVNEVGGRAYKLEPKHALAQVAATGTFGNAFYSTAETQLDEVLKLIDEVDDNQYLAKLALYAREKAFMKDMPAALLVALSVRDTELMHRVFDRVVDNGRVLRTVFQMIRSGQFKNKAGKGRVGLSSSLQRAFQRWLNTASVGKLLSASIGNDPSLRDILRMARPTPKDNARRAMFGWLTDKSIFEGVSNGGALGSEDGSTTANTPGKGKKWAPATEADLPVEVQSLIAYRNSESEEAQAFIAGGLDNVRWDLLSDAAKGPTVWAALARKMGPQALRMNLNTLLRHDVLATSAMVDYVADRIADESEIRRSKQFPYQYFAAYLNADDNVPQKIKTALHKAAEIACGNVPELPGPVVIGLDTSGSMSSAVTGHRGRGATSKMRCIDVAALFAAAILRRNPDSVVIPFDTSAYDAKIDPNDSILSIAERLAKYGGGGTDCSLPLVAANQKHAKRKFAGIVLVSDNESWVGTGRHGSTGVMTAWEAFTSNQRKLATQHQPHGVSHGFVASPKLINIDLQPYQTVQACERADIMNIGGFSDAVFNVISAFLADNNQRFVAEVEAIEL
jgi:60 kDa SS-A/Ro ribonucleoprotein